MQRFKYKIKDFGKHKFWGKTESQDSVVINIEKGQEYFVRCGIKMGVAVGKPEMHLNTRPANPFTADQSRHNEVNCTENRQCEKPVDGK